MLVGLRVGPGSPAALLVVGRRRRIPDWPYDLAVPVAHRAWSRLVQVHGLVEFVQDGVLLYVPWWKVPVNMQPKFQQSLPIDRQWMVPFPFIDRVLDIAGMLQRQLRTVCFVQKTGESTAQFLDEVVTMPVVANDRNEWVQRVQKVLWLWTSL